MEINQMDEEEVKQLIKNTIQETLKTSLPKNDEDIFEHEGVTCDGLCQALRSGGSEKQELKKFIEKYDEGDLDESLEDDDSN